MKRSDGLQLARRLKEKLHQQRIPVQQVFLFGSVARDEGRPDSDIDIAVVCLPFGRSRLEEGVAIARVREDLDLRIETICLHPDDLNSKYSTIAQEIRREGIAA